MHLSIQDRPPEAEGIRVLHAALDAGVTLIDTADVYCLDERDIGHNERLIARALAGMAGRRDQVDGRHEGRGGPHRRALGERWPPRAASRRLRAVAARPRGRASRALPAARAGSQRAVRGERRRARRPPPGEGKIRWVGLSNVSVGADPGGRGDRADHHGAEPAEPVLPGGADERSACGTARSRGSGSWPTARSAAAGSTASCRTIRCSRPIGAPARRVGPRAGAGLGAGAVARRSS